MEEEKQLVSTEMAHTRSLMARTVAVGAVQDVHARDLLIEDLRRPPPSGLVARFGRADCGRSRGGGKHPGDHHANHEAGGGASGFVT